ncbi:MAG: hypothetical protein WC712_15405 [Candidatus Brocadiia bacterium]
MLLFSNVERSVYEKVKSLLVTPPGGFTNGFNIYDEDDFRDSSLTAVFPYVYLLGFRAAPQASKVPMIVIDTGVMSQAYYEIGNRGGNVGLVSLHIFAKTRGQRDDFGAFFREYLYSIPINDYSATPATALFTAFADGINVQRVSVAPDVGLEGVLNNWVSVTFQLLLLQ